MKLRLVIAMAAIMQTLFLAPAWSAGPADKKADPEALQALKLATGKQIDPELKKRVDAFNKHFKIKEAAYITHRDATIQVIKDNPNFTDDEKTAKIGKAQQLYKKRSWTLVHKYREPINLRLFELTNSGLPKSERVEAGMGKPLYNEKEVIVNGQKKTIRVRNPEHSGALSDTDSQAGPKGIHQLAKVAQAHGIKVVINGNTVDMPDIEHTVNRHAFQIVNETGERTIDNNKTASSTHDAELYADARNKERFLFVGIDDKDASLVGTREAVEKNDHMKKAADGINLATKNPKLLLQQKNRDKLQTFGKSTNKMASNISNAEIGAILKKNNLSGTPESYKKSLSDIHNRNWGKHGVNNKNVDAWFKTSRDIQELSIKKANQLAASEKVTNNAELDRLSKTLKTQNLTAQEKRRLTDLYVKKKTSIIDANERLKQTKNALDEKLGKTKPSRFKKPILFSDIPSQSTTRKKINAVADKNFKRIGKGMGYYAKLNQAYYVATLFEKGDAKALVGFAYDEAKDEISDRIKERLVPGYGNMKLAFDVGWGTGRLIGANVRLGPGGPTVDEVVEKQMFGLYDGISGNRQMQWDQQRETAYHNYLVEQVYENPGILPPGMTTAETMALAKKNAGAGGNVFGALDNILEKGENRIAAEHRVYSKHQLEKNAALLEDTKRDAFVREALNLGFNTYGLSGKNSGELQAMIEARKIEIAKLEQEEQAWKVARNLDTQKAYVDYATVFPDGEYFDQALALSTERFHAIMTEAEKKLEARKKAAQAYNFDDDDDAGSVDTFRKNMALMKDKAGESPAYSKNASAESVFDQGIADQKKYKDDLAYIEKAKRETAEIWRDIREKRERWAKKKAQGKQFWNDFSTAVGQIAQDHNEQQQRISTAGQQPSSSYVSDGSPCFRNVSEHTLKLLTPDVGRSTFREVIVCTYGPRTGTEHDLKYLAWDLHEIDPEYFGGSRTEVGNTACSCR